MDSGFSGRPSLDSSFLEPSRVGFLFPGAPRRGFGFPGWPGMIPASWGRQGWILTFYGSPWFDSGFLAEPGMESSSQISLELVPSLLATSSLDRGYMGHQEWILASRCFQYWSLLPGLGSTMLVHPC